MKSALGILFQSRKHVHSKVAITTINITPISAATGIISMNFQSGGNTIKQSRNTAAEIPDKRPRPPELMFIMDWPIIAHPPILPKNPETIFATPCPTHSRLLRPRVSVISSINVRVIRDSIRPMAASVIASPNIIVKVCHENRISGILKRPAFRFSLYSVASISLAAISAAFKSTSDTIKLPLILLNSFALMLFSTANSFCVSTKSFTVTDFIGEN